MSVPTETTTTLPRFMRGWEQFWFAPADPSVLGLIRIACGMIVVYTFVVYCFNLQEFMGEHAWYDLELRNEHRNERPIFASPLNWNAAGVLPEPANEFQRNYRDKYREKFTVSPPPPYPRDEEEAKFLNDFRAEFGVDMRINGLKLSREAHHRRYAREYTKVWRSPPPAYVESEDEATEINRFRLNFGVDPRMLSGKGSPIFSLWFHVLDPNAMMAVHLVIVAVAIMFTFGLCTRITSALLWFGSLSYIHRNQSVLFGVDTMMTILLLYLMIGPSGAAYSLDRWIRQWWVDAKPRIVARWYAFWKMAVPTNIVPAAPVSDTPEPSVSANIAIRLLQIHVCFIYGVAGLSKLQGATWWNGNALWVTIANYEFAPMQFEFYMAFIRFLGRYQLLFDSFMYFGCVFTLVFEIGYPFLIWQRRTRWAFLGAAIMLHGGIGLFMGLKTFAMMMLVMNMAFLRPEEVAWLIDRCLNPKSLLPSGGATQPEQAKAPSATA